MRGREGEREGDKHRCERETSIVCFSRTPQPETRPTTQEGAPTGNRTGDLTLFCVTPNLSHAGQDSVLLFNVMWPSLAFNWAVYIFTLNEIHDMVNFGSI